MDAFITILIIVSAIFIAAILAGFVYIAVVGRFLWFSKYDLSNINITDEDDSSEDRIEAIKTEVRELTNHYLVSSFRRPRFSTL